MPDQLTLATQADGGFDTRHKPTQRDVFFAKMDKVVLWAELCAVIEPFYPRVRAAPTGSGADAAYPVFVAMVCAERSSCIGGAV